MFTHHRNHGYWLAWLDDPVSLLAELMGKLDAPNGGRAGSQEISFPPARFHSGAMGLELWGVWQNRQTPVDPSTRTGPGPVAERLCRVEATSVGLF